ncbi:Phthiocerol/phenolphthiocerol synthesis polyketide synthase type I PpsA [BD1-7 clade bacterium]|uniref:Phthiocerol/phenolphthiocerol synthesis polyketide synthase type I PpsA n=1 Tax=BD1-7 clade bacterium TaxID=2029982 RepID=A0A5S9QWJ3_9GAMM|nr:Phthiocerol/phenolphthiocerol synthesis polyketide synthase type I PpsA [BD1-7 clade bacterium]
MENIAVIGIANLFPGSKAPGDFWAGLLEKSDSRSQATVAQMGVDPNRYYGKKGDTDKFYCMQGGYINDFAFDANGFNVSADYLTELDDLYQWALYVTRQALQDAGYWQSDALARCGAILGNLSFPTKKSNHLFMPLYQQVVNDALKAKLNGSFELSNFVAPEKVNADNALIAGYPSSLLAKAAGLGGSHFALDAACASSCYSVKLACDQLHTGKADLMLAGAVSGSDPMFVNMGFSIFQAYPANQIHAPLDSNSQGLFAGEGAGMMVLKRHSDAVRDGDHIHAIIKGGALSNDGKGEFVLSPNTKGQVLVYERAYEDAGVNPADVDYVECHATGTPKGDKVELGSMETFFSRYNNKPLIGSVKSNLGHLLTAAGMPGMTKAIYALNEGVIPPTINLNNPIQSKGGYFSAAQMPTDTVQWPANGHAQTCGVSVFGFGGSNAHLVMQAPTNVLAPSFSVPKAAEPMAIIGMDAHFGAAAGLDAFNHLVDAGQNNFTALPPKRWKGIETNATVMNAMGLAQAPQAGYLESFEIDFLRFKIPPNPQDSLIPQQLLMMQVADNAAREAELSESSNVAVLVAMGVELELHQYRGRVNLQTQIEQTLAEQGVTLTDDERASLTDIAKSAIADAAQLNQYTSFIGNIMASRISALWDFSGPAITVSAEENSVYRCVELAQSLFQTSDVDAVIVAAVDLAGSVENISLRRHFGEHATAGEGAGAFVLKPQSRVDANKTYATIDGIGFSQGNDSTAIQNAAAQALQDAGTTAANIDSVEAHASGFANEDAAEHNAFAALYAGKPVDSAKKSVGHTFNASGMPSILKAALALDASKAQKIAINGLGRDDAAAHLVVSQVAKAAPAIAQRASKLVLPAGKKQLNKTIVLGGDSIAESIANAELPASIEQAFAGKSLPPVSQPVYLENLAPAPAQEAAPAVEAAPQAEPVQAAPQETAQTTPAQTEHTEQPEARRSTRKARKAGKARAERPVVTIERPTRLKRSERRAQAKYNKNTQEVAQTMTKTYKAVNDEVSQQAAAHSAFIDSRNVAQKHLSEMIELQVDAVQGVPAASVQVQARPQSQPAKVETQITLSETAKAQLAEIDPAQTPTGIKLVERYNKPENIIFDTDDLVEFAEGDIGKVFGPEYDIIDTYSRRVRLPTTDYLLVTRVTDLEAKTHEYKPCYMATEYDIPTDAPFLIDGQIPWSVSVESGQCDLMLISYLGIDFQCKGERVYRLLDCQLTFLEDMAFGGETLRYEIKIDSFAKNGDQVLFFFHYDCYVNGKKVLIMRGGCAGFFTDEELADGKGVIHNDKDKAELANAVKSSFTPLINNSRTQYEYEDMMKLVNGDIASCFGPEYDQGGRNPSLKFSSEKFLMIERVTKVDRIGGHWGLGILEGEKRLEPDHWYFPCHFKGDQVMAGSLMSEGCGQLAMFFMLWLGMHGNVNNARFQPVPGESQTVRCRGQVLPQSNTLTYRMEVTAMGMEPHPFMKANIDIILDGKVVVDFKNLSVMIKEQDDSAPYAAKLPEGTPLVGAAPSTPAAPAAAPVAAAPALELDSTGKAPFANVNAPLMWVESNLDVAKIKGVTPIKHREAPMPTDPARQNRVPNTVPFTPWHMFEFATGNISNCFGPDFDVYEGRIPPRTPCGDLQVVTQVIDVQGERLDLKKVSSCVAEYEVPADAWYFTKNSHENWMPYSILMEISLQPNGFISGYMGTTLKYPEKDLFFRNLDGSGKLLKEVDLRGKTITNKSVMLSTSIAGGSIIQSFTFELLTDGEVFYEGKAVFGYFSNEALTNQLGIDNGRTTNAWFVDNNTPESQKDIIDLRDTNLPMYTAQAGKPHYKLAGGQMNFVDTVTIVEGGGKDSKGYVFGERTIDPTDWFFRYHFHQDPVMPGSLGVEAIIELLQVYALKNDLGAGFTNPRFIAPLSEVVWKYRGQITPENKQMALDVHITDVKKEAGQVTIIGDANLSKDGLRIYEVKDIVLSIVEA